MNYLICTLISIFSLISSQSNALDLVGTITKDHKDHSLGFDLALGDESSAYDIFGRTVYTKGFYEASHSFNAVTVTKNEAPLSNGGLIKVYPKVRELNHVTLAGLSLQGSFLSGWFDKGLWLQDLSIGNAQSQGCLDYNSWSGKYSSQGPCSFGDFLIQALNGPTVFDYDYFFVDNVMHLSMAFGDLSLNGTVIYSNTYGTKRTHEGKGRISNSKVVTSSIATFEATVLQSNGSELSLDNSSHDNSIQRLIAFLELMAMDIFVE